MMQDNSTSSYETKDEHSILRPSALNSQQPLTESCVCKLWAPSSNVDDLGEDPSCCSSETGEGGLAIT